MKLVDGVGVRVMKSRATQMWVLGGEFRVFMLHDVGVLGRPERACEQKVAK